MTSAPVAWSFTVTRAGPSGSDGSVTITCGLATASARSRRTTAVVPTVACLPPEVNVTSYARPATSELAKNVTGVPEYVTLGRIEAGGGGGLAQPQPASAAGGRVAARMESTPAIAEASAVI